MELIIVGYTDNNFNWTNLTITEVLTETINIVEMIFRLSNNYNREQGYNN